MKNIHVSYAYGLIIIRNIKRGTADFRQTVASRYSPVNPSEKRGTIVNLRWNSIQSLPCGDSTTWSCYEISPCLHHRAMLFQ